MNAAYHRAWRAAHPEYRHREVERSRRRRAVHGRGDRSAEYTRQREQFGQPLASFQALQHRMAEMLIQTELARSLVLAACRAWDTQAGNASTLALAAKAKVDAAARSVTQEAIQMHGATGVSQWSPLSRMYASQRTLRLADGPDEVHHMVVGRNETRKYDGEPEDPALASIWRK